MEFNIDKIMQKNTAIRCRNKKQAELFLNWARKEGFTFNFCENFNINSWWERFEGRTCYDIERENDDISYDRVSYYESLQFNILEFEDVTIKEIPVGIDREYDLGNNMKVEWSYGYGYLNDCEYSSVCISRGDESIARFYLSKEEDCDNINKYLEKYNCRITKEGSITIRTDSGEALEISKTKARELGFKINEEV